MNTLKLHLFGIVLADLYRHILHQNKYRLKPKSYDLRSVTVKGILDSDIQGEKNQEIFRNVMGGVHELTQTEESTGIRTTFSPSISTEQDEPLLLLPDHLAGFYYSKKMYGKGLENSRENILHALEPILDKWPSECFRVFEYHFGEKYLLHPEVFDYALPKKQRKAFLSELLGPQRD